MVQLLFGIKSDLSREIDRLTIHYSNLMDINMPWPAKGSVGGQSKESRQDQGLI
jgi:hypothetical protein